MQDVRIVVFSDSHGDGTVLEKIILENTASTDVFIHLGDGEKEVDYLSRAYPDITLYAVRGNCDNRVFSTNMNPKEITPLRRDIVIADKKILCVHGHEQNVKFGLDRLIHSAKINSVDIALYGHTHQSFTGYEDGLYIMNPGSVRLPNDGVATYGRIDIGKAGIILNIVTV